LDGDYPVARRFLKKVELQHGWCLYFNHDLIGGYPFRLRKSLWGPFLLCSESLKQTCGTITGPGYDRGDRGAGGPGGRGYVRGRGRMGGGRGWGNQNY